MTTATSEVKDSLSLGTLSEKFYDFVCDYFQFATHHRTSYIIQQLTPWFDRPDENVCEFYQMDIHSQFYAELVQQKYRLALEFCALEAGFENVVLCDPDNGTPISGGLFWLRDCHPQPIHWTMNIRDKVVTRGVEEPGTLNIDTIEDWLLNKILSFASIKKEFDESNRKIEDEE